jgi:squalene-associated FAD-dependent desaturase
VHARARPLSAGPGMAARRLAVVGAGWAGLAAAVRGVQAGWEVSVFEMAPAPGGRARSLAPEADGRRHDNGQHILIGAYRRTLDLMATVGADAATLLHRQPLELRDPAGAGIRLPAGPAWLVFGLGVARADGWGARDKLALLGAAARWMLTGFRCEPGQTVAGLCRGLPSAVRQRLIDPLCVAALNTPAHEASAAVFLRVLRDSMFSGPGSSDLLLPRAPLGALLPEPAWAWLQARGAVLHAGRRVQDLALVTGSWHVDDEPFDAVVLAASAAESARLAKPHAPGWSARTAAFGYEPIITVIIDAPGLRLAVPMLALQDGPQAPAQFVFDQGALGGPAGQLAFVVSAAAPWVARGLEATAVATLAQARLAFGPGRWPATARLRRTLAEKRATFRCVPALDRPPALMAPGLVAAGDYLDGPYPATLEGAVRSGEAAIAGLSFAQKAA